MFIIQKEIIHFSSRHKIMGGSNTSKRALILGAGFVSAPVVDYLTRDDKVAVTVGRWSISDPINIPDPNKTGIWLITAFTSRLQTFADTQCTFMIMLRTAVKCISKNDLKHLPLYPYLCLTYFMPFFLALFVTFLLYYSPTYKLACT